MLLLILIISIENIICSSSLLCQLPLQWSGNWYQNKDIDIMNINKTHFLNRGLCIEHKEDKFIFYDSKETCYRCVFIMQKHLNILQFRASYCTEQSDFYSNCQNLSPESELVTLYRDDASAEKCPLSGLYTLLQSTSSSSSSSSSVLSQLNFLNLQQQDLNYKCGSGGNENSYLMECADPTMIKFQLNKCTNLPTFDVNCVGHWSEGNTNYLIGRTILPNTQKRSYKCLVYTELNNQQQLLYDNIKRYKYDNDINGVVNNEDFIELSSKTNQQQQQQQQQDTIQISISQDEFCRNIDNIIDDQSSFTFSKITISKYLNPISLNRKTRQLNNRNKNINNTKISSISLQQQQQQQQQHSFCRFPKWFNKRWNNIKQTKLYTLDHKLNTLNIFDDKKSTIIDKHDCLQIKSKKHNSFQALVRSLNGCSSSFQCITIISRSDFLTEIRFNKIKSNNGFIDCSDHLNNNMELVYIDSSYGVSCPFKGNVFRKTSQQLNDQEELDNQQQQQQQQTQQPCKLMTQTQTLQIGCSDSQQYSLRTKLCYPNQLKINKAVTNSYTQLESEINLVCLAHWHYEDNLVVISRSMSNEILCSVWSSSNDNKILKFYEIDSNCNYHKKNFKLNHEFQLVNKCENEKTQFAYSVVSSLSSSSSSSSSSSLLFLTNKMIIIFFLILYNILK